MVWEMHGLMSEGRNFAARSTSAPLQCEPAARCKTQPTNDGFAERLGKVRTVGIYVTVYVINGK